MNAITDFLYKILEAITDIVQNHGVSIIIFTFLMRMVCVPFDYKSRKNMRKMQLIQPKLNALQKKYANDKQKYQQKQAELMRKEHYNPLSGCLPLLKKGLYVVTAREAAAEADFFRLQKSMKYLFRKQNLYRQEQQ